MKKLILVLSFFCFNFANAQNTNVTINSDLNLKCKFEKVILKNPNHNFETFSNEQVNRADINKLIIESKTPNTLNVKNLSKFIRSQKPSVIFHLAAQPLVRKSYLDPLETFKTNSMGVVCLLEAIRHSGIEPTILNVTTDKVYKIKV